MFVWTLVVMFCLIGFVALVCDLGYLMLCGSQLQNAADAASLAGAQTVHVSQASVLSQASAIAWANQAAGRAVGLVSNPSNGAGGDIVIGQFSIPAGQFTPTLMAPNAVKVTARLTSSSPNGVIQLIFGPALGLNTASLTRTAIAMLSARADGNAGIIVLDPHAPGAMTVTGNGNVTEVGGDVQVNSDSSAGLTASGDGTITANDVDIVGSNYFTGYAQVVGQINTGSPFLDDPLALLPEPPKGPNLGTINLLGKVGATINPGYYSGGISLAGQGNLTLNPGIYVVDGAGLNLTGSGKFTANGVTIFVTGTGKINITGNGAVQITPPDPAVNTFVGADTYQGVSIFQARADTRAGSLTGNGNLNLDGVVYAPGALLSLSGNGDTFGSEVISNTLMLTGNGLILVKRSTGHVPPLPQTVYLVQ